MIHRIVERERMTFKKYSVGLLAGTAACLFTSGVLAAPITTPIGFNPGDQYRPAFITTATTEEVSGDIDYYNDFVTNVANAIASTSTVDARYKTGTNTLGGAPIYQLNALSSKIADNGPGLWDAALDGPCPSGCKAISIG